jgi:hypothetical protein
MLRANITHIIHNLFMINPTRNSTVSVLAGILGLYTGSVGPADVLLRKVLNRIDEEESLNLISSSETWNAFRNNWSRSHVEAISSSLQSPFALIDSGEIRRNIVEFNPEIHVDQSIGQEKAEDVKNLPILYRTYDPLFWLPVIAFCLEKLGHSSDLTLLVDNFSIGYVLVCLSSKQLVIRKMAASLLLRFEHLSEVTPYFNHTDYRCTICENVLKSRYL